MNKHVDCAVNSLQQFLTFVRQDQPDIATFIYRGQVSRKKTREGLELPTYLLPSLFRQGKGVGSGSLADLEIQLLTDFRREAPAYLTISPGTDIEWMALAQHHGLPTRLLDWSTNPLVALFFAVEQGNQIYDSRVYKGKVYDTQMYDYNDGTQLNPEDEPFKLYIPTYIDRRLEAQESCFTLHPLIDWSDRDRFDSHFREVTPAKLGVTTCLVPMECFGTIKTELSEVGISYKSLFPGLDGICRSIAYRKSPERAVLSAPWPQE